MRTDAINRKGGFVGRRTYYFVVRTAELLFKKLIVLGKRDVFQQSLQWLIEVCGTLDLVVMGKTVYAKGWPHIHGFGHVRVTAIDSSHLWNLPKVFRSIKDG